MPDTPTQDTDFTQYALRSNTLPTTCGSQQCICCIILYSMKSDAASAVHPLQAQRSGKTQQSRQANVTRTQEHTHTHIFWRTPCTHTHSKWPGQGSPPHSRHASQAPSSSIPTHKAQHLLMPHRVHSMHTEAVATAQAQRLMTH
jgi:hypothetical protein